MQIINLRLAAVGQETSAATLAMVSPRHVASNRHQVALAQQNLEHTLANRHSVAGLSFLFSI